MHEARMVKVDSQLKLGEIMPEVVITNSHDRSSRAMLDLGFWRKACDNGLVVNIANLENFQLTHIGDLHSQIVKAVGYLTEYAELAADKISSFQARRMTGAEIEEFANRAAALRDVERATRVTQTRRQEDVGDTLWLVYNRAQENLLKGNFRKITDKGTRNGRPVTSIRRGLNLNKDLWALDEEFLPN